MFHNSTENSVRGEWISIRAFLVEQECTVAQAIQCVQEEEMRVALINGELWIACALEELTTDTLEFDSPSE
jgi:hypothetical protein